MKITKLSKGLGMLLTAIFVVICFAFPAVAQEKEKEVKIKVVKEKDGERTVLDTTYIIKSDSDLADLEELQELLEREGMENIDIDFDMDKDGDVDVEVVEIDGEDGAGDKIIILKHLDGEKGDGGKQYKVKVVARGEEDGMVDVEIDGDKHAIFVTEDGEMHELEIEEGAGKVLMYKTNDGEDMEVVVGGSGTVWVGDGDRQVEVVEDGDGKKVIVKKSDGTTHEYELTEGKGTYIIGKDGALKKDDADVEWIDAGDEEIQKITVDVDDGNNVVVIKRNGETIELKDYDADENVFFYSSEAGEGEQEVFVEVIEKTEGDNTVRMKSKIIVTRVGKEDIDSLEKSGVQLGEDQAEKLEIDKLVFHPNPSDGKFRLEFSTPEHTTTEIVIYDIQGKTVYNERITNFKGQYDKEIDISSETQGTYFLKISQGNKMSTRKIILE